MIDLVETEKEVKTLIIEKVRRIEVAVERGRKRSLIDGIEVAVEVER